MRHDRRRAAGFFALAFPPLLVCGSLAAENEPVDALRATEMPESEEPRAAAARAETPAISVPTPPGDDLTGRGLLDFRDRFPLATFHLQGPTRAPPGLATGQTSAVVQFDWANTSAARNSFLVDAETYTLRLGFWHALRRDFYLGAETAVEGRDGGILDEFIDGFHDTFNINVSTRNRRPHDAYEIVVDDRGRLREIDRGFGLGNTALKAHWIFSEGGPWRPTLSLQALLNLPTSTRGFGARGVDLGVALMAQKKVSDHLYLYAVGGATYLPDPTTEGLRYEEFNYQLSAGLEVVLWWDSVSLIGQYVLYSPLLKDTEHLDRERQYVGGAIKHRIHPRVDVIWGFMENLPPLQTTADVTFHMGCEYRF